MTGSKRAQAAQPGILEPIPRAARYLSFGLKDGAHAREALRALAKSADGKACVVGLGALLLFALKKETEGLRPFPHYRGEGFEVPSTPAALWCWLRGEDRGEIVLSGREIEKMLSPAFEAAISGDKRAGIEGSSFVAVQQWVHDLDRFSAKPRKDQDDTIGRRRSDNQEIGAAPPSAHVKRTAQESFTPEAFVLRRSMPWADATRAGLVFVAFGRSLDAFEAQLKRMAGEEDGTVDALFTFTRPVTGAYFWCPPVRRGRLDLRAIGL